MKDLFGKLFAGVLLLTFVAGAGADKQKPKKEKGSTDPKGVPLELRLVAKKAKYPLDLGGQTGDEFRKQLEEAKKTGKYPAPPAVDFTLEMRNTGKKDLQIHVQGDMNVLTLNLKGPGAVSASPPAAVTADFRLPKTITLAAGKSHSFPALKSLTYGFRGVGAQAYWTKAGDYTLTATYTTAVSPAPKDAKDAGNGFGSVTVTSAPVKVKVTAK
jgi:hypothetical protein